jgi:tRNA threonylcarbamoyl adenosine modification protein (Sua5/YciO/YrdC/YwlC family)
VNIDDALEAGLVVVIPTDTVYGVAVNPFIEGATDRLFAAKQRPHDVDLPVLVADKDQALALIAEPVPDQLMDDFWPGALTIVMCRRAGLDLDLGTRRDTIGIRCPDHDVVRDLCRRHGPLAVTSANLHGQPTPATAAEVAAQLGDAIAAVINGGPCAGAPSTVVDATGDELRLLREGRLPWTDILQASGRSTPTS